MHYVTD